MIEDWALSLERENELLTGTVRDLTAACAAADRDVLALERRIAKARRLCELNWDQTLAHTVTAILDGDR